MEHSDPARKLSANLYDIYCCCVYSENPPDDGQRNCPKHVEFHSKNKFEKLVHLVGFIIRNKENMFHFVFMDQWFPQQVVFPYVAKKEGASCAFSQAVTGVATVRLTRQKYGSSLIFLLQYGKKSPSNRPPLYCITKIFSKSRRNFAHS